MALKRKRCSNEIHFIHPYGLHGKNITMQIAVTQMTGGHKLDLLDLYISHYFMGFCHSIYGDDAGNWREVNQSKWC